MPVSVVQVEHYSCDGCSHIEQVYSDRYLREWVEYIKAGVATGKVFCPDCARYILFALISLGIKHELVDNLMPLDPDSDYLKVGQILYLQEK